MNVSLTRFMNLLKLTQPNFEVITDILQSILKQSEPSSVGDKR